MKMSTHLVADFESPSTGGKTFRLKDHVGRIVVLYFYPRDGTSGCTTEALQFRDLYPEFVKAGAVIAGVSRDSLRSHESFKARHELPFDLIADTDEKLCAQFSVIAEKKRYGRPVRGIERSTFVIGGDGALRREWRGVKGTGHAQEVLDFVGTIVAEN
jgi:peroxiredoxin Q/BCP